MIVCVSRGALLVAALVCVSRAAPATAPKLDVLTCADLRIEQQKAVEAGLAADVARGPEWAKANLTPERLRQLELFIAVDEQVKFGCRDAKLTADAERAAEAARRLELNPDLDPTAPLAPAGTDGDDAGSPATETDGAPSQPKSDGDAAKPKPRAEKPKAAAKPKATDAYTPPANTGSVLQAPAAANALVP